MSRPGNNEDLSAFSMLDLFRAEAESQTAVLAEGLLALEQESTAPPQILERLMRAAHSLKGAARIVGLDAVVAVSHALEDCFVAAQKGLIAVGSEQVDILLRGTDYLSRLSKVAGTDGQAALESEAELVKRDLQSVRSGEAVAAPEKRAAPPPPIEQPPALPAAPPPSPVEQPPARPAAPAAPAERAEARPPGAGTDDRAVKVRTETLTRIAGFAAESLVQARRISSPVQRLRGLSGRLGELSRVLERLEESFGGQKLGWRVAQSLVESRQKADECRALAREGLEHLERYAREAEDLASRLHQDAVSTRMRPFGEGTVGFPRLVRDLARQLGKKVRFDILGKATRVDRDILERLEAPLTHLLRNALDHGLESPEERAAAGKEPEGALVLEARHHAGLLHVTVSDDGRGIDMERLRTNVVAKGLTAESVARSLSDAELLDFLFLPGFSTAGRVTEVSGRGVGLDVVRDLVSQAGGTVSIENRPGSGAGFHLRLPVTRSVVRALLVDVGGDPYAAPLSRIDRVLRVPVSAMQMLEGRRYVADEDRNIGLVEAREVLELPTPGVSGDEWSVVAIGAASGTYGLVVDRILGETDLVIRPLDPRLGRVPDISAASLLEDGTPVLLLDIDDLQRSIEALLSGGGLKRIRRKAQEEGASRCKRVLVVDDSLTVRQLERTLLLNHGYDVDVAVDGVEAWNTVRLGSYDLVVTDVDMPRMNGIDLVRHLKQDPRLGTVPIVVVSYKDRAEDRMRGLEAGANYYLTKSSFHDESFIQAVIDLIGEPSS